jgi:hypothetical protein
MTRRMMALPTGLIALLAMFAVISSVASAAMELPVFSGNDAGATGSYGKLKFVTRGGAAVACKKGTSSMSFNGGSRGLGPISFTFEECSQALEPCRNLAGTAGTISMTGEWHLVLMIKAGNDSHYFLVLLPSFGLHIECPAAPVRLLLVLGSVLGPIVRMGNEMFNLTVKDGVEEDGPQEFSEYENEAGTAVKAGLEDSQEGGADKEAFENITSGTLTFPLATAIEK